MEERAAIFIDGSNFYHGMRSAFPREKITTDFSKFIRCLSDERRLIRAYYYNIAIPEDKDLAAAQGQQKFFSHLRETPYLELRLGRLEKRRTICPHCCKEHDD